MTIWFQTTIAPETFAALKRILLRTKNQKPLIHVLELREKNKFPDGDSDIGLLVWLDGLHSEFLESLDNLYQKGLRRFILFAPIDNLERLWRGLPTPFRITLSASVPIWQNVTSKHFRELIVRVDRISKPSPRLELAVAARRIYPLIRQFSHNTESDISNQILAPARLLLSGGGRPRPTGPCKNLWTAFTNNVLSHLGSEYGAVGNELLQAAMPITRWANNGRPATATDFGILMSILTILREEAGEKTVPGTRPLEAISEVDPVSTDRQPPNYRILVVDDHAGSWKSVFERVASELGSTGKRVCFEFSTDGERVMTFGGRILSGIFYGYYDLVILDVFLLGRDGRDILRDIRRSYSQLPVLLWTTSRDEEIAADATLANGILLKKTVTWENFRETVARWVERGHALRTRSLPNPFFNHTIVKPEYREIAVSFHEWCLKQLDSFHALDGEYFRYFTDHGGRHIVKLWELLEQALQPFLEANNQLLLPAELDDREFEILGLYLTVACHELGMFPMRIMGKVEDFSKLGADYLDDVRALHAPRGMVLIYAGSRDHPGADFHWNDERGRELGQTLRTSLHPGECLGDRLAVLVGYHARFFSSLREGDFLKWERVEERVRKRLAGLRSSVVTLARTDEPFKSAMQHLDRAFNMPEGQRRLRCQCALFRFVDAMDISASRNPAEFLIGSNKLSPKNYVEQFKRELCKRVGIQQGKVEAVFRTVRPDSSIIAKIVKYVDTAMSLSVEDKKIANTAMRLARNEAKLRRAIKEPWKLKSAKNSADNSPTVIFEGSVLCLQKLLDSWLKETWTVLVSKNGTDGFISHLKKIGVLNRSAEKPLLTPKGAKILASVTGLSVAGEVLDEYQAIADVGLAQFLQLGEFHWATDNGREWQAGPPAGIATLRRIFATY
jgi:CheY-like chemotaxis protein